MIAETTSSLCQFTGELPATGESVECGGCGRSCDKGMVLRCRHRGPGKLKSTGEKQPAGCCGQSVVKPPSAVKRVASAATSIIKWLGDGGQLRSAAEQATNLAICHDCPLLQQDGSCTGCGCNVATKVRMRLEECPAGKWFPDLHPVRPLVNWTRNLIYHVLPVAESPLWRWNLDQLAARPDVFNGRRVLAIAREPREIVKDVSRLTTAAPNEVLRYCDSIGLSWDAVQVFENNPALGEVVSFRWLLDQVANTDSNQTTCYMHAKGVRHWNDPQAGPLVKRWADWQYHALLDDPASVQRALERYSVCGSFLRDCPAGKNNYHFSGTFFEGRNNEWFSRDWQTIRQTYFGTEWYPADLWERHEACGLSHSKTVAAGQVGELYNPAEWAKIERATEVYEAARQSKEST